MFSKRKNKFIHRFDVRLTVLYTTIFFSLALILCSFLYYRLNHNLVKQVGIVLADEVTEFKNEINEELLKKNTIQSGCEIFADDISKRKYYPMYFRLYTSSGQQIFQSDNSLISSFPNIEQHITQGMNKIKHHGSLLVIEEHLFISALKNTFILQIGTSLKRTKKTSDNFLYNIIIVIPVMLLFCIIGGMTASRKVRDVLRNIISVTKRITSKNLKERLIVPHENDEIKDLTVTINSMIDRLEKSFEEIKHFTSDVSHELRNPLFALKGEIEVTLSQKRSVSEYQDSMQFCLEKINTLIKMVNDLFLITRFDSKKIQLDFEDINICDLIKDLYDFFLPITLEKKTNLNISQCDEIILTADRIQISQLINNLLDNAVKFTPENGMIDISLVQINDNEIELCICDNGKGIPQDKLKKIFDRFYQVDPSRTDSQKGTGLGLHICKRIVHAHNGSIRVNSNTEQGVSFIIRMPIEQIS
ncbi:sensor histidine kinase [Desulfobacula phenolica]|uniref:histidine kinase n=1 Tax=Desulfobacula phenolica TaxID=90732 RepID=A0A1H2GQ94_9BACT|nr:ATP-binding protein [Desulfobacula phenolica]SDU21691.1 heavy metal sensor kinase [Desulfobacula phenolica]